MKNSLVPHGPHVSCIMIYALALYGPTYGGVHNIYIISYTSYITYTYIYIYIIYIILYIIPKSWLVENCKAQGCQQQHGEDWSLAGHPRHTISRCQACQTKKRRIFNKIMKNASLFFWKNTKIQHFPHCKLQCACLLRSFAHIRARRRSILNFSRSVENYGLSQAAWREETARTSRWCWHSEPKWSMVEDGRSESSRLSGLDWTWKGQDEAHEPECSHVC